MTSPRQEQHNAKKVEWMEKCFECYAENGLTGTGMKALAKACGCNINGRQHIQSGKYFRYQKDVQALKTTAGAAAGVARVAGVSLVGVLSGLGYTLLKRKKLF